MKTLVLIGASGHGKVCAEIAEKQGYEKILFLDWDPQKKNCAGYDVKEPEKELKHYLGETDFFVSIGDPETRCRCMDEISSQGGNLVSLIHPSAVISPRVKMGEGCAVMAGAVINADSVLGRGVIVNTASSVDHDCVIGDFCHIAVGAHVCGTVTVGDLTWIGAGAVVSNNITICGGCMIGAGAAVVKDIAEPGTYVGVPAGKVR